MKLTDDEQAILYDIVRAMGGYTATAEYLTRHSSGITVNAAEVWRAANGRGVSRRLFRIISPPRPRIRFCIECQSEAERTKLRELCHNLSAADLIRRLEEKNE